MYQRGRYLDMPAATVVYGNVVPDFTKRTPEEIELEYEYCVKLKYEVSEAEIIRILQDDLDMANLSNTMFQL
jgi:hypothetical protein